MTHGHYEVDYKGTGVQGSLLQTQYKECNHKPISFRGWNLHPLREATYNTAQGLDFLISMSKDITKPTEIPKLSASARKLLGITERSFTVESTAPAVYFDWKDFGLPYVQHEHIFLVLSKIVNKAQNIGVFCTGGHGRTGTMLALLLLHCGYNKKDLIAHVRSFCGEFIETESQEEYIVSYALAYFNRTVDKPEKKKPVAVAGSSGKSLTFMFHSGKFFAY